MHQKTCQMLLKAFWTASLPELGPGPLSDNLGGLVETWPSAGSAGYGPTGTLIGAQEEPNRNPKGNRKEQGPKRNPTGTEPKRSPAETKRERNRNPKGNQQETQNNMNQKGTQQEPNPTGTPTGPKKEPQSSPA